MRNSPFERAGCFYRKNNFEQEEAEKAEDFNMR
jgi:hypothetical protein